MHWIKRLYKVFVLIVALIPLGCCLYPAALVAYDSIGYRLLTSLAAPWPKSLDDLQPTLLIGTLPGEFDGISWAADASSITVRSRYPNSSTQDDPIPLLIDTTNGEIIHSNNHQRLLQEEILFEVTEESLTAVCKPHDVAISASRIEFNEWQLKLWRDDKLLANLALSTDQWLEHMPPNLGSLTFSPDCRYFTLTFRGWTYREGEGREELYILNTVSGTLLPRVDGRWATFRLWDYPVQRLHPSWAPDSKALVFGDPYFGQEFFNVYTGERKWLAMPRISGWFPLWSATGQWIASSQDGSPEQSIFLVSSDGELYATIGGCQYVADLAWDPLENRLAYLCDGELSDQRELWLIELP
jgi:hypothetical protein